MVRDQTSMVVFVVVVNKNAQYPRGTGRRGGDDTEMQ